MTQYLLSIYQPDGDPPPPEVLEKVMRAVGAFTEDLKSAGVLVFTGALRPPSEATVLRPRDDHVHATEGPFIKGREHIGGFWIISAEDLDDAREWARKAARAVTLPIELRPFHGEITG